MFSSFLRVDYKQNKVYLKWFKIGCPDYVTSRIKTYISNKSVLLPTRHPYLKAKYVPKHVYALSKVL